MREEKKVGVKHLTPDELTALFMRKEARENAELADMLEQSENFNVCLITQHVCGMLRIKAKGLLVLSFQYSNRTFASLLNQFKKSRKASRIDDIDFEETD